jgi:citrate synthase
MSLLHDRLDLLLPRWRAEQQLLIAQHGEQVIDNVTLSQVLGGMRGVRGIVCDTSSVDPKAGLFLRGRHVSELAHRDGDDMFWLLLTGDLPDAAEKQWLLSERQRRSATAEMVASIDAVISTIPSQSSLVVQYAIALLSLQSRSRFALAYGNVPRSELWREALEDALNLRVWAHLVMIRICQRRIQESSTARMPDLCNPNRKLDELRRLYEVVHADHENGNASAFACHVVGSALSDPFLAVVASVNALAGPIHGMAAQTCLEFVLQLERDLGADAGDSEIAEACRTRLNAKQIIPGFGHAVLRSMDPRFELLLAFGERHCAHEPLFRLASRLYRVAPQVLLEHGGVSNPWPNVDATGGVLLWCCGLRDPQLYTIMFSLAQMNGLLANYVLARGLGLPIMRPRSVSLQQLALSERSVSGKE